MKDAFVQGAERAWRIGEFLYKVRYHPDMKRGDWYNWLAENCKFSERHASNFLRVYTSDLDRKLISGKTLPQALRLIQEIKNEEEPEEWNPKEAKGKKNQKDYLASLQRAWDKATEADRKSFISKLNGPG